MEVKEAKIIGQEGKHLKLKLSQNEIVFDAIAFGFANDQKLNANGVVSVAYTIEENVWNNKSSIQLKIKIFTCSTNSNYIGLISRTSLKMFNYFPPFLIRCLFG